MGDRQTITWHASKKIIIQLGKMYIDPSWLSFKNTMYIIKKSEKLNELKIVSSTHKNVYYQNSIFHKQWNGIICSIYKRKMFHTLMKIS
jgi:hypothetical protein